MYIDYSTWETFEYTISTLQLDVKNPRIRHKDGIINQRQIIQYLVANEKVYDLAKKMSEEGYFVGEEPIICLEGGKKVVLEGNRRVAALKVIEDPDKYLTKAKAKNLKENIKNNKFSKKKQRCYIAPNRLEANPIIYERHHGSTLQKWKTGNQYAFVADMYHVDCLSIEDICRVLNEKKSKVIRPLKAYNLFVECRDVLFKEEGNYIDIANFDITNLERLYTYEPARELMGIVFSEDTGALDIQLPREEFESRILVIFKKLIDAEAFSREFNDENDKKKYIEELKKHPNFDLTIRVGSVSSKSITSEDRASLEEEKNKKTHRTKKKASKISKSYPIIPKDKVISFENDKLNDLFAELKTLPVDKKFAFANLLRTYLEQSLFYFLEQKELLDDLNRKVNEDNKKNGIAKVKKVISYIKGKHHIEDDIDVDKLMELLRFSGNKEYSGTNLQTMLNYVVNQIMQDHLSVDKYKNLKQYIKIVKEELDLSVHNINRALDVDTNKRAWAHLEPVFDFLSNNLKPED